MKYLVIIQDGSRKEFCLEMRQSAAIDFLDNVVNNILPDMSLSNRASLKKMLQNSDENVQSVTLHAVRFSFMFSGF